MRPSRLTTSLFLAALAAAAVPGVAAAAPAFTCEASAFRGTVQNQSAEPVVYGRGQECASGQAAPSAAFPGLLGVDVLTASGSKAASATQPAVTATGGLAGARVNLLPAFLLPASFSPTQQQINQIPQVEVPGLLPGTGTTVDIRDAVRALFPSGMVATQLFSADVLRSTATAGCTADGLRLEGASTITGIKLLGRDIALDGPLEQNLTLIDSASIDPSKLDLSGLVTLPGVTLPAPTALQDALDQLPPIEIPATVVTVKLTPAEQTRDATSLTQRALRLQASIAGQLLLDVVVGEAKVSAVGDCPTADAGGQQPVELQCSDRRLVLLDVFQERGRVRLRGAANKDFAGKLVDIRFRGQGNRIVARARVARNGSFTTTAALPPRRIRAGELSRYTAVRGRERSLPLKLVRRMRTSSVRSSGGYVTIRGRILLPLARPVQTITLRRRVACGKQTVVARFKPRADGTFSVRVRGTERPAVYRATTRVRRNTTNPKTYETFTLPRGIDLAKR